MAGMTEPAVLYQLAGIVGAAVPDSVRRELERLAALQAELDRAMANLDGYLGRVATEAALAENDINALELWAYMLSGYTLEDSKLIPPGPPFRFDGDATRV